MNTKLQQGFLDKSAPVSIAEARAIGKRANLRKVIIFYQTNEGEFGYASYGHDRAECPKARQFADCVFDLVMNGEIEIP